MQNKISPRFLFISLAILAAGLWRVFVSGGIISFSNFTPVGAMALFGGAYFSNKRLAFLFPLLTLWLSDIIIDSFIYGHGLVLFYSGWYISYAAFALMVVMGLAIKKPTVSNITLFGTLGSFMHWVITNFGVWAQGSMYPKTGLGLMQCYTLALPFLSNSIVSTLVFSAALFGSFELAKRRFPILALA